MAEFARDYGYPEYKHETIKGKKSPTKGTVPSVEANSFGVPEQPNSAPRSNIKGPHDGGSSKNFKPVSMFERRPAMGGKASPEGENTMPQRGKRLGN